MKMIEDNDFGQLLTMVFPEGEDCSDGYYKRTITPDQFTKEVTLSGTLLGINLENRFFSVKYSTFGKFIKPAINYILQTKRQSHAPVFGASSYDFHVDGYEYEDVRLREISGKITDGRYDLESSDFEFLKDSNSFSKLIFYEISVSQDQKTKLKSFLDEYINLYEERKLEGQSDYKKAEIYHGAIISTIYSDNFQSEYGFTNIPLISGGREMFCHSVFLLDKIGIIKIRSFNRSARFLNQGLSDFFVVPLEWKAIVDVTENGGVLTADEEKSIIQETEEGTESSYQNSKTRYNDDGGSKFLPNFVWRSQDNGSVLRLPNGTEFPFDNSSDFCCVYCRLLTDEYPSYVFHEKVINMYQGKTELNIRNAVKTLRGKIKLNSSLNGYIKIVTKGKSGYAISLLNDSFA